jgi:hypothetical protein
VLEPGFSGLVPITIELAKELFPLDPALEAGIS